jgi:FkbM family methyltransferase
MHVDEYWSHSFILDLVRPDGIVFDFGLNDGGFARIAAARCRRVVGFEPDPSWHGKIRLPSNVELVTKAIARVGGYLEFNVNGSICSSLHFSETGNTEGVRVEAVTLDEALAMEPEGLIDLIKMDIEGEEVAVLLNASPPLLKRVVQLTVEFHDFVDPRSVPEIKEVIKRMTALGFLAIRFSWRSYGDLLFINTRLVDISAIQKLWLEVRYKYVRGLGRILKRCFTKKTR